MIMHNHGYLHGPFVWFQVPVIDCKLMFPPNGLTEVLGEEQGSVPTIWFGLCLLGWKSALVLPASRHIVCPGCHNIYSQQLAYDRVRSVPSFKLDPCLGLFELVQKKNNLYTKWHLGKDVLGFQNMNDIINAWVSRTTADVWMGNNTKREKWKVKWVWRALHSGSSVVSCKNLK